MANKWLPLWGERNRDVEHFRGFKTQIDSLFEDWFGRSMGGVLAPRVDVTEDDKAVTVTAELPGVTERDLEVSLGRKARGARREERSRGPHDPPHRAALRRLSANRNSTL